MDTRCRRGGTQLAPGGQPHRHLLGMTGNTGDQQRALAASGKNLSRGVHQAIIIKKRVPDHSGGRNIRTRIEPERDTCPEEQQKRAQAKDDSRGVNPQPTGCRQPLFPWRNGKTRRAKAERNPDTNAEQTVHVQIRHNQERARTKKIQTDDEACASRNLFPSPAINIHCSTCHKEQAWVTCHGTTARPSPMHSSTDPGRGCIAEHQIRLPE